MPLRMAWKQGQEPKDLMAPSGRLPLTEECKHYYDSNDMPGKIKKYACHHRRPQLLLVHMG